MVLCDILYNRLIQWMQNYKTFGHTMLNLLKYRCVSEIFLVVIYIRREADDFGLPSVSIVILSSFKPDEPDVADR